MGLETGPRDKRYWEAVLGGDSVLAQGWPLSCGECSGVTAARLPEVPAWALP